MFTYSFYFPGTGKTTTLVQFAKRNRHLSIGYCVYNKSVVKNAQKKKSVVIVHWSVYHQQGFSIGLSTGQLALSSLLLQILARVLRSHLHPLFSSIACIHS